MADYADRKSPPVSATIATDPENGQLLPAAPVTQEDDAMSTQDLQEMEKLLSRIRRDAVYELRKLQHHHKPVSGFDSKLALEELLEKRRTAPPPTESAMAEVGSEVDRQVRHFHSIGAAAGAQEHMPTTVRLEIRGLNDQHRVSEMLNSARAEEIERTLGETLQRRNQQTQRRQQRRARPPVPHPPGRGETLRDDGFNYSPALGRSRPTLRQPENGQYPMPQRDQNSILRHLQDSPALGSLQPADRDRIVGEVDNLVQQHLVTSTLSGELRGVLELHIQTRAEQVRTGFTVEDIGRSLQRRNDYAASTTRPFDPDVPSSAAVTELRQELRDVKSQVLELKQLMRTSFDLQLEIQRAIRQEVAAALSSAFAPQPPSVQSRPSIPPLGVGTTVVESGNCVICSEASINSVVYRCGHMCVCMQCGLELKAQGLKCPICRAPITEIIRAYSSMQ